MEIRNLLTFTKVAEVRSLSGAARELGYAQSTVTAQMQQLEQELGVPLYERVGKQIRITREGQELLGYAASIIRMSEEARRIGQRRAEPVRGRLRLGVSAALEGKLLARQLSWFAAAYPEVEPEVHSAGSTRALAERLRHNDLDLMLVWEPQLTDSGLICAHAEPERPVLAAAAAPSSEERREELLICGADAAAFGEALAPWSRRLTVESPALAVRLAQAGTAVLAAPESLVREYLDDGSLKELPGRLPDAGWLRQTVYHRNKWRTDAMNAWLCMLEERSWEE